MGDNIIRDSKFDNCANMFNFTDYSKQITINNYNIIMEDARKIAQTPMMAGLSYDRFILAALKYNNCAELTNLKGYIKNHWFDKKNNKVRLYICNVFCNNLYVSNHLVIYISREEFEKLQIHVGMYIQFSGHIHQYVDNHTDERLKFGINNFTLDKVLCDKYQQHRVTLLGLTVNNHRYSDNVIIDSFLYDEVAFMNYLRLSIEHETIKIIGNKLPYDYYLNMILSIHLSTSIEKHLMFYQQSKQYLDKNAYYLCLPLSGILLFVKELRIKDPYTIYVMLNHLYDVALKSQLKNICILNNINEININRQLINNIKNIKLHGDLSENWSVIESIIFDYYYYLVYLFTKELTDM